MFESMLCKFRSVSSTDLRLLSRAKTFDVLSRVCVFASRVGGTRHLGFFVMQPCNAQRITLVCRREFIHLLN